jgi:hypothetical protein
MATAVETTLYDVDAERHVALGDVFPPVEDFKAVEDLAHTLNRFMLSPIVRSLVAVVHAGVADTVTYDGTGRLAGPACPGPVRRLDLRWAFWGSSR